MTAKPKDEYVAFKSIPEMFEKEKFGSKCNTIRKLPIGDERENKLRIWASLVDYGRIAITNTKTKETFLRQVTDITIWQGWMIISWEHPNINEMQQTAQEILKILKDWFSDYDFCKNEGCDLCVDCFDKLNDKIKQKYLIGEEDRNDD